MKIENVTIQGFRGFNEERSIDFHPCLTLIYGPNSYGKTSISEALEWLLYGVTSKVERADSKEEYRGSYRNRHLPKESTPFVRAVFLKKNKRTELRSELTEGDEARRFVDGHEVDHWPLLQDLSVMPRPFILQHALKYLLLVGPDERFQGFAKLLGLEDLDQIQRNVVSLCTKPEACIPTEVGMFLTKIASLESRLANQPSLMTIHNLYKKEKGGFSELYTAIAVECRQLVSPDTAEESVLPQLLKIREDAVSKVFSERITLVDYTDEEKEANGADYGFFLGFVSDEFAREYADLIALATIEHVSKQAQFCGLGMELLNRAPSRCPFCGQHIDKALLQHIQEEHDKLEKESQHARALEHQRQKIVNSLVELRRRVDECHRRHTTKVNTLLSLKPSLDRLSEILVPKQEVYFRSVENTIGQLEAAKQALEDSYARVVESLQQVETSVQKCTEDPDLIKVLGKSLVFYAKAASSYANMLSDNVSPMSDADQILKYELDVAAGTEDIGVLIDLVENRTDIGKKFEIVAILDSLKELRRNVDHYVASTMLDAIYNQLSVDVMEWYQEIRTTGDPDVHFTGFDIDRTKKGDLKARRVQIKAKSYDMELVSAVSSLSESKLNALGLCVSISTNLKPECPFDFLIIDDPIQSWDSEHEIQFIGVVTKLVERGKQVILLSHNKQWVDQVRRGCRSLNGLYYEITGYTKVGPHIQALPWCSWAERLGEIDAIIKDPTASSVRLQQAEEEIRIVVAELTSELYLKKKGAKKDHSKLNASQVRKALVECGVESNLVDRVTQTFETTDKSHHAPKGYAAHKQRINKYKDWAYELANLVGGS